MILSKRITANNREANPEIQASNKTVKVMRELRPAAFVNVEVFICLDDDFLSGNISFLEQLIKRTGKNSIGRYDFLKLLATEFKTTKSKDAKEQVLANLANFAYDPINYGYIRQLKIIDLFLHTLSEDNLKLIRFAVGGICNVCVDPINKLYILRNQGIQLLTSLLSLQDEDIILSVITTLIFLINPDSKNEVTTELIEKISHLSNCKNKRIKNLITIFFNDCIIKDKIENSKSI